MRTLKFLFLALITLLFIVFAVANREAVEVTLYPFPYSAELPKFLLVIISFALGALVGGMTLAGRNMRSRRLYRAEHKRVMALENELQGIKAEQTSSSLPVTRSDAA